MTTAYFYRVIKVRTALSFLMMGLSSASITAFLPVPTLPKPSGPHLVGTAVFHLVDSTAKAPTATSDQFRDLMIQVWYPARVNSNKPLAPYLTNPALAKAMEKEKYLNLDPATFTHWQQMQTYALLDAPLSSTRQQWPLLLFSPGAGVARVNYTSILEEIASYGYVVVAIDHPFCGLTVLPNGKTLSLRADSSTTKPGERVAFMARDASFVLEAMLKKDAGIGRFARAIDTSRVGIFGHSLGGAAALEAGRIGGRFKACLDLDGDTWGKVDDEGVNRPYLVMLNVPGEPIKISDKMRNERDKQWQDVLTKKNTPAILVKLKNTNHFSFTDAPFIQADALLKNQGATMAPVRGHEIVTKVIRAFFDKQLKGETGNATPLSQLVQHYSELSYQEY